MRLVIGLIGVSFALNAWFGRQGPQAKKPSVPGGVFWGVVAGFTSTLSQAGGPPFQVYVLPQRLPKLTLVGTYPIYSPPSICSRSVPILRSGSSRPRIL